MTNRDRSSFPSVYKNPLSMTHDSLHRRTQRPQHPLHFASAKVPLARVRTSAMNKPLEAVREPAVEIRFGQVGLAQVRIRTTDAGVILDELTGRVASAPQFFERTAVCLDLSALEKDPSTSEMRSVFDAVRRAGMLTVGLAHGTAAVDALARSLDVPVLTQFRVQGKATPVQPPVKEVPKAAPPTEAPVLHPPSLMQHQPVRSGQRVYARNSDLVVTATVGAGAEVIADGCVHIYGTLRGRAVAGARGEVTARVFCQEFHAELISIAGVFRVFETLPPELAGKPVQAWLDGDDLRFARIGG
jgi:septum site-determining protein MinC